MSACGWREEHRAGTPAASGDCKEQGKDSPFTAPGPGPTALQGLKLCFKPPFLITPQEEQESNAEVRRSEEVTSERSLHDVQWLCRVWNGRHLIPGRPPC